MTALPISGLRDWPTKLWADVCKCIQWVKERRLQFLGSGFRGKILPRLKPNHSFVSCNALPKGNFRDTDTRPAGFQEEQPLVMKAEFASLFF